MINFRWGQAGQPVGAAGQASGFNLADARAISRGFRKDKRLLEGTGEGRRKRRAARGVMAWVHLRTPTRLSSVPQHPSLPPFLPPNLAELSG